MIQFYLVTLIHFIFVPYQISFAVVLVPLGHNFSFIRVQTKETKNSSVLEYVYTSMG